MTLVVLAGLAGAEESSPMSESERLMHRQEYPRARRILEEHIEAGGLAPTELSDAYQSLGECYAALRMPEEAEGAFRRVLALSPDFSIGADESPLVRTPFVAAQRFWQERRPPTIRYRPPAEASRSEPLIIDPEVDRGDLPELCVGVFVFMRGREGDFDARSLPEGGLELQAEELDELESLELMVAILDEHGNVVVSQGTMEDPVVVALAGRDAPMRPARTAEEPVASPPWYGHWWVWTLVGVVVVGAAVGVPLGLTLGSGDDPCEGSLGGPCDLTATVEQ